MLLFTHKEDVLNFKMKKNTLNKIIPTNDAVIRMALKEYLNKHHSKDHKVRIIEELGLKHGAARIDIAVVNGVMHGYEIKSDLDTLLRLPEQMNIYNSVFDKVTLVVGKSHLHEAINIIPDWWGITIAKINGCGDIAFCSIRESKENIEQDNISIAKLLWKDEALNILEEAGQAKGFKSKSRIFIYEKLSTIFSQKDLEEKVRETLFFRGDWRPEAPLVLNGD